MTGTETPPEFAYPSTWRGSVAHWWTTKTDQATAQGCEDALIRRGLGDIQFSRDAPVASTSSDAAAKRTATLRQVQLSGKERFINVLEIGVGERKPSEHNLLLSHGYGGGLAFYWQQLRALSAVPNTRLFVIDWLGMGRSGRPPFPKFKVEGKPHSGEAVRSRVTQAESFFVESLEEFREKERLSKMTLLGHSLGGYFSVSYALKHPERVNKLILISPVGVPEAPFEMPDASEQANVEAMAEGEFQSNKEAAAKAATGKAPSGWWTRLWEANISPFGVLRWSSFLGPKLAAGYAARRYAAFPNDVQKELFDYLWLLCGQRGSGEYSLAHILAPGAYARWPLINRLKASSLPVTFIYGDHDWMDPTGGRKALEMLRAKPQTPELELQHKRSKVVINPHSGHWVFLENPEGFNKIAVKEIQDAVQDHSPS